MSKVIVIGSQKGGVGKTTTTLNLAYSLCSMGKKVLAIDLDSQANLSTCYGIENTKDLEYTIGHLLMAQIEEEEPEELEHYIQSKGGVDFIPSSIYLSAVEAKLRTEMGAERMLAEVLAPIRDRYLMHILQGEIVRNQISSVEGKGATVSNFNISDLRKLKFQVPDKKTQL